jgi:TnpA family transposase
VELGPTGSCSTAKDAELTGDREDQETSMLALRLLQAARIHLNTIFLQRILEDPAWAGRLTDADWRLAPRHDGTVGHAARWLVGWLDA